MTGTASVLNGQLFAGDLMDTFESTYDQNYDNVVEAIGMICDLSPQTTLRTTKFGYRDTAPYPARRPRGEPPVLDGFKSYQYSVTAYNYASAVSWHRDDRMDNQVGDIVRDAQRAGDHFVWLPTAFTLEALKQSADLLYAIPNAPDGAALFSATDGAGNDRFGVSGGNLYSGNGITAANVRTDLFGAIMRMATFQNTKGRAFFPPSVRQVTVHVWFAADEQDVFAEAIRADLIHSVVSSTGAAITNLIMAGDLKIVLHPTAEITDNDYFIAREDAPVKPLFTLTREQLRSVMSTEENSDDARKTGNESIQFECRMGFGVNLPIGLIKVNNS